MAEKNVRSYANRLNLPDKDTFISNNPTKVEESPLDARSPQEVLDYHGMYRDPSYYEQNPDRLYLDLTQFDDYETYLNNIRSMETKFMNLSPDVRARFNNDLSEFSSYVSKPDFDIYKVLDDKTKQAYDTYKAKLDAEKEFEAYQASAVKHFNEIQLQQSKETPSE